MTLFIIGIVMNVYTWQNIDFFVQKKYNENNFSCEWVDKGWSKPKSTNPSLTVFGQTKWKQECVEKSE